MAFYAEMKRRKSWRINGINRIYAYRLKLHEEASRRYEEWYASLTEEQKLWLKEKEQRKREQNDANLHKAISNLLAFSLAAASVFGPRRDPKKNLIYGPDGSLRPDASQRIREYEKNSGYR